MAEFPSCESMTNNGMGFVEFDRFTASRLKSAIKSDPQEGVPETRRAAESVARRGRPKRRWHML
jgi:hypothetical protein